MAGAAIPDDLDDRRDSPRIPIRVRVSAVGNADPGEEREGDLSIGGVWFRPAVDASERLRLSFDLPEGVAITAVGEVIGSGPEGTRVRFVELTLENELAIARALPLTESD